MAGVVAGPAGYMAPEQADGRSAQADERADIYALGAVLYHLLTLNPPIRGKDSALMVARTREGDVRPATDYDPRSGVMPRPPGAVPLGHCPGGRMPGALAAIAMKCLALKPADRYPGVQALQRDLSAHQAGFAPAAEAAGLPRRIRLWARRHKAWAAVSLVAVMFLSYTSVGYIYLDQALRSLRSTAPALRELALNSVEKRRLDKAIEAITRAVQLDDGVADYHRLRGDLLQTALRLPEAVPAYEQALALDPGDASARANLALTRASLRSTNGPDWRLAMLLSNSLAQERSPEAGILAERTRGTARIEDAIRSARTIDYRQRLVGAGIPAKHFELSVTAAGTVRVRTKNYCVSDLSVFKGLPVEELVIGISQTNSTFLDLSPLRAMPLHKFQAQWCYFKDLSPLAGMDLEYLELRGHRSRT